MLPISEVNQSEIEEDSSDINSDESQRGSDESSDHQGYSKVISKKKTKMLRGKSPKTT